MGKTKDWDQSDEQADFLKTYFSESHEVHANGGSKKTYPSCYSTHKELTLGGGVFLGASCNNPREGFDVYIGLSEIMYSHRQSFPWRVNPVVRVHFPIKDGRIPEDTKDFKLMVTWVCKQLQEGKRVHAGCVGGHGRTGLLLAAVVATLGEKNAIQWVRKHHCTKAVESTEQVDLLMQDYGASYAPSREVHHFQSEAPPHFEGHTGSGKHSRRDRYMSNSGVVQMGFDSLDLQGSSNQVACSKTYTPAPSKKTIWK